MSRKTIAVMVKKKAGYVINKNVLKRFDRLHEKINKKESATKSDLVERLMINACDEHEIK